MGIILAILLFSAIIIIHELGHFLLAKANGIRVDEFSLGLGPTLFGKQFGETKFSVKLLPFGGACMMGEDDVEDISEGSFNSKSVWARMSVIVAGPLFNLILAWILCMIMIAWVGYRTPVVGGVIDGYSAQEQGLSEGDVITKIGGRSVHIWNDISLYNLTHSEEKEVEITYKRDGKTHTAVLEPRQKEGDTAPLLGVTGGKMERPGFFGTLKILCLYRQILDRLYSRQSSDACDGKSRNERPVRSGGNRQCSRRRLSGGSTGRVISDHPESDEYRDSDHGKPRCDESSAATGTGWRKTGISDH